MAEVGICANAFRWWGIVYPELWEEYINFLPLEDRKDPYPAYLRLLTSEDYETRLAAARYWNKWELGISKLVPDEGAFDMLSDDRWYVFF